MSGSKLVGTRLVPHRSIRLSERVDQYVDVGNQLIHRHLAGINIHVRFIQSACHIYQLNPCHLVTSVLEVPCHLGTIIVRQEVSQVVYQRDGDGGVIIFDFRYYLGEPCFGRLQLGLVGIYLDLLSLGLQVQVCLRHCRPVAAPA